MYSVVDGHIAFWCPKTSDAQLLRCRNLMLLRPNRSSLHCAAMVLLQDDISAWTCGAFRGPSPGAVRGSSFTLPGQLVIDSEPQFCPRSSQRVRTRVAFYNATLVA